MAIVDPSHLLAQANLLISPIGGGAPRQTDLRRAISNAYYAVFHSILTAVADQFVGKARRKSILYSVVYRSVGHKTLRGVCENIQKKPIPAKYSGCAPKDDFGPDLSALAAALVELYEKRHLADYDPLFRANRSDAALLVGTARTAVNRLKSSDAELRQAFLVLVVFAPR
jgi:hypothetical protein